MREMHLCVCVSWGGSLFKRLFAFFYLAERKARIRLCSLLVGRRPFMVCLAYYTGEETESIAAPSFYSRPSAAHASSASLLAACGNDSSWLAMATVSRACHMPAAPLCASWEQRCIPVTHLSRALWALPCGVQENC